MKKLLLIFSVIVLASCSSNDAPGDVITNEFDRITSVLSQGTWKVTTLIEGNEDHAVDFESLIFIFNADGTVISETDLYTETGNWHYRSTSQNGEQLVLEFSDMTPFDQIDDDWTIVSVTSSKVELSDDGDNEGDPELLVFSKL